MANKNRLMLGAPPPWDDDQEPDEKAIRAAVLRERRLVRKALARKRDRAKYMKQTEWSMSEQYAALREMDWCDAVGLWLDETWRTADKKRGRRG